MTPVEVVAALEKALEAGPMSAWLTHPRDDNKWRENSEFAQACSPLAIRTLLDAHASALRDAARYKWLEQRFLGADFRWGADEESGTEGCQALVFTWPGGPVWGDLTMTLDHCTSALDDNTKGAAE